MNCLIESCKPETSPSDIPFTGMHGYVPVSSCMTMCTSPPSFTCYNIRSNGSTMLVCMLELSSYWFQGSVALSDCRYVVWAGARERTDRLSLCPCQGWYAHGFFVRVWAVYLIQCDVPLTREVQWPWLELLGDPGRSSKHGCHLDTLPPMYLAWGWWDCGNGLYRAKWSAAM